MGTRHLVIVYHDGSYKLAQFGQWDGTSPIHKHQRRPYHDPDPLTMSTSIRIP